MAAKRVNVKGILADVDLRRKLMVSTIQATQAREGIETTADQANRAYYIVTESERAAFFGLKEFRGVSGQIESRHDTFVNAIRAGSSPIRIDIRRADFGALDGAPLAYKWVGILASHFRDHTRLDPTFADARQGLISTESERFVRHRWECGDTLKHRWVPYAKGGDFCRFYSDIYLCFDWTDNGREIKAIAAERYGSASRTIKCEEYYFRSGITWVEKTVKGMNARLLPAGAIFNVAGPSAFPRRVEDTDYLLGLLNANLTQAFLDCFSSRSWGAEYVGRIPVPNADSRAREGVGKCARYIHDLKAEWDRGNELSSRFDRPWLIQATGHNLTDRLEFVADKEKTLDERIRTEFAELNALVYALFRIAPVGRGEIEKTLGARPDEFIWPQLENRDSSQKRMEHVWRLLSYSVKCVVESDDDGAIPFPSIAGDWSLADRVRQALAKAFPEMDESVFEVEIVNELKRNVKGYRKCDSLEDWLENVFFDFHSTLYKGRPIFWHIASSQGTAPSAFGALLHYHRLDKNLFAKLRSNYVRDTIEELRREVALADRAGRVDDRIELQAKLEEVQSLDKRLQLIQEGHHEGPEGGERDFRILTPWKEPCARPRGWDPDLDDGVKVNIAPLDRAGVLRVTGVAG